MAAFLGPDMQRVSVIYLRFSYWAALSLSFRLISIVNEHNSLGSPGNGFLPHISC